MHAERKNDEKEKKSKETDQNPSQYKQQKDMNIGAFKYILCRYI
jgi:hypothetical protein